MKVIFKAVRLRTYLALALGLGAAAFEGIVVSYLIAHTASFTLQSSFRSIWQFCLGYFIFYTLTQVGRVVASIAKARYTQQINLFVKKKLLQFGLQQQLSEGDILAGLTNDVDFLQENYFGPWVDVFSYFSLGLVSLIYALSLNPLVALVFIVLSALGMLPSLFFKKYLGAKGANFTQQNAHYLGILKDQIAGFFTLKSYQATAPYRVMHDEALSTREDAKFQLTKASLLVNLGTNVAMIFGLVFPLFIGLIMITLNPHFTAAKLVAIMLAADRINTPFVGCAQIINQINTTKAKRQELLKALTTPVAPEKTPDVLNEPLTTITLAEATLGYDWATPLLTDVDLALTPQKKILLTGASGLGKSTLLQTLAGWQKLLAGTLSFSGPRGPVSLANAQAQIATIHQSPFLFQQSIRFNLTLGAENYSDEELLKVLAAVHLEHSFGENPLDYGLTEHGDNLSVGQKQRLEIARALLRQRPFIFADEITAALDAENARSIRQLLYHLPVGVLEIAHHFEGLDAKNLTVYHIESHHLCRE